MNVDLDLLQSAAEKMKKEWDEGDLGDVGRGYGPGIESNPGAVAEMTLRLIEEVRGLREQLNSHCSACCYDGKPCFWHEAATGGEAVAAHLRALDGYDGEEPEITLPLASDE